jgi:hypothetical protein
MAVLLWDKVDRVGCSKVCCNDSELFICDFLPLVIQPTIDELGKHIHQNKYISNEINFVKKEDKETK